MRARLGALFAKKGARLAAFFVFAACLLVGVGCFAAMYAQNTSVRTNAYSLIGFADFFLVFVACVLLWRLRAARASAKVSATSPPAA